MKIKSIDIQNYHGIEKLHMDFQEGVNLLIGNNGAGKTSLLNAISIMLHEPISLLQGVAFTKMDTSDAYQTTSTIGEATIQTESHYPIVIDAKFIWRNVIYSGQQRKENESAAASSQDYRLAREFKDNIGNASVQFPLLCFLPAQRGKLKHNRTQSIPVAAGEPQRSQGYQNAFNGAQNIDAIQNWCVQMEFAEYQRKAKIKEYSEFQTIVSSFLSFIDENAKDPHLYYSSEKGALVYFDGASEKPLHQLSDGFQAVLCIIIDLAYRSVLLNPAIQELAQKIDGIVLIDEIEMHLHPAWQWKILDALQKTFPKVQFIIATHSPIILSSAKTASLFLMKSPSEVLPLSSAYGYQVNDVLSLSQGTMAQPESVNTYYDQIESILETGSKEDLGKLLKKADEEFSDSPVVLQGLHDFVEVNQWVEDDEE